MNNKVHRTADRRTLVQFVAYLEGSLLVRVGNYERAYIRIASNFVDVFRK